MCTVRAVTRVINSGKVLSMLGGGRRDCQRQIKTKYEPAMYMFTEPAENGVLLKEYRCVYAFQVNYAKLSDCNKIIRRYFNESFYF